MEKGQKAYPNYKNPPVIEVVCGIHFNPIATLLSPHLGLLWEKYKSEYPTCREVAPLGPVIETFGEDRAVDLSFSEVPPMPRIWFVHKNDTGIIQIQRDRFWHNWRKIGSEGEYPRYPKVIEIFKSRLSEFQIFLKENKLGNIEPRQYEMTYINHICQGEGWMTLNEIGKIFPDFNLRDEGQRFLPAPEGINWRTTYVLPEGCGRLHVTIRNAKHRETGLPMLYLDLTVRGIGSDKTLQGMESWFDLARKWIVLGFADLTGNDVQEKVWGRID